MDDSRGVGPFLKILVLSLVAFILFALEIRITLFSTHHLFSYALTIGGILFLANAFNLLDNMNGLSAGTAVMCCLSMLCVAVAHGEIFIACYLVGFIGALCGFLKFNFPKGEIFLGDSGALFIGYNLAVSTILQSFYIPSKSSMLAVYIPLFVFSVPFYDTLSVILIRVSQGSPIYKGDQNHFSHRLWKSGFSRRASVIFIWGIALFNGLLALFLLGSGASYYWPVVLFAGSQIEIWFFETILKTVARKWKKVPLQ